VARLNAGKLAWVARVGETETWVAMVRLGTGKLMWAARQALAMLTI
jgi:hypothetical protein